jgi:hypothetical protein
MSMRKNIKAQSTVEFTFAMVAMMFLIYGMVMVFRWAGMDLAQRRYHQDTSVTSPIVKDVNNPTGDPASQLNSDGDVALPMSAVYHGSITNGNSIQ